MNIENLRTKLTKDFADYYGEEGLAVVKDYCDDDNEVLYFIISDTINRSCSNADTVLLNILRNKLNINNIDEELHTALCGKLVEILNKKHLSNSKPFDFINGCDPAQALDILQREMPQTIAVVLSFLDVSKAALLLQNFPCEIQYEVAKRITTINRVETETIREMEKILENKLLVMAHKETIIPSGGVEAMVEILNLVDRATEKQIIEKMEDEDPELAEEIKKRMFVFEDIIMLDDRAIQKVMREVDSQELAMSLKGASVEIQNKIFKNMSKRAASILKEDMEYMGPVRLSNVEEAQTKIISICRYLEETGEIIIAGDDMLVDEMVSYEQTSDEKQKLPYDSKFHLLAYGKKEELDKIDNNTLAISLFGMDKGKMEMVYKKMNFNKKIKVKGIIKKLKDVCHEDIFDAQTAITEALQENLDENDIR